MPRASRAEGAKRRHKKVLKLAKGYRGAKSRRFKNAKEQVMKSLSYAYRDRRTKKRNFRRLWIVRINAAARLNGLNYNALINGLKLADVDIDRKVLADLAVNDPEAFAGLAKIAKEKVSAQGRLYLRPKAAVIIAGGREAGILNAVKDLWLARQNEEGHEVSFYKAETAICGLPLSYAIIP